MVQWNNPAFLADWRGLMAALGARFDHDPRLGWVDIGGYGSYGEWHLYQQPGTPIGEANMATLIRDVAGAFPDKTVWSHFGSGYGFVPLVLPVLGLLWLRTQGRADSERP